MHTLAIKLTIFLKSFPIYFRIKIRHDLKFEFLGNLFGIEAKTAQRYFWVVAIEHFRIGNFSPRLWNNPQLGDDVKNEEFRKAMEELDPYFNGLAGLFADPSKQGKQGFIVNIDSTNIFTQIPGDAMGQKDLFSLKNKVLFFLCNLSHLKNKGFLYRETVLHTQMSAPHQERCSGFPKGPNPFYPTMETL